MGAGCAGLGVLQNPWEKFSGYAALPGILDDLQKENKTKKVPKVSNFDVRTFFVFACQLTSKHSSRAPLLVGEDPLLVCASDPKGRRRHYVFGLSVRPSVRMSVRPVRESR